MHRPQLTTQFVCMDVALTLTGLALRDHIEAQLQAFGQPLRWAITSVDGSVARVEAVVTLSETLPEER